jgi:acetyl coenzyme A synthetase (ADP forming)-like protein
MKELFTPESIAIIGASNDIKKWGGRILNNIKQGYTGTIHPINPKETIIQGLISHPSITDAPECELAIIVTPAPTVISIVDECGRRGTKAIIVITAGFAETGNKILEKELHVKVKQYGMRMLGPNTLGFANNSIGLNASILQEMPKKGNISFIAQSGSLALEIVEWAKEVNVGLCKVISVGNKTNIDDVDLLQYLDEDLDTKVIGIYAESIKRGREFIKVAKQIKKPIVILKVGRSKKGAAATFSHTASLSGDDAIYSVAFKQAGILRVDTLEELFDALLIFSTQPIPMGNSVGIISNGGGSGIIATDECDKYGIELPDLTKEMVEKIKPVMPTFASPRNPIDSAAVSRYETYKTILDVFNGSEFDMILPIYIQDSTADPVPSATAIAELVTEKPIVVCSMGGKKKEAGIKIITEAGPPVYSTPNRAVKALSYLLTHKKFLDEVKL